MYIDFKQITKSLEAEVEIMPFPSLENYKIQKKITTRLCYSLYDAIDKRDNKPVFLKILDQEYSGNQDTVANFTSGARIARMLNHPNIVKIYDSGEDQGHYFISSEPIEFEPLKALILEIFSLSFADLAKIFTNIAKSLTYAHLRGVVHGFLNPNNVYISSNSDIKIDDLGFNWFVPNILTGDLAESTYLAQYIAPEYYRSAEQADGRADIYSVGVVLFEFLTGKTPFNQKNIAAIQEQHLSGKIPPVYYEELQLPVEFSEIINKSINKFIEKRFQNSSEFVRSLEFLKEKYLVVPTPLEISEQQVSMFEAKVKKNKSAGPPPIPEGSMDMSPEMAMISYEPRGLKSIPKKFLNNGLIILALLAVIIFGKSFFFDTSGSDNLQNGFAQTSPDVTDLSRSNNIQGENSNSVASALAALDSLNSLFLTNESNLTEVEDFQKSNAFRSELNPAKEPKAADILEPVFATMDIFVVSDKKPIQANIFLDEKFVGISDENGRLTVSQLEPDKIYAAKVSIEGYTSTTKYVTLSNEKTQVTLDIKPEMSALGTLIVNAIPGADSVLVNDVLFASKTPFEIKFQRGEYRVKLVNTSLQKSWEQTIELKAGQVVNVKYDFTSIEQGKVAVSIKNAFEFGFGYVYVDGKIWQKKHNTTPLEVNLEVGSHKIAVRREGFVTIPADTTIVVDKNRTQFVSFKLTKKQ